jgi:hypothetical protein
MSKHERIAFKEAIVAATRQMSVKEIRELADNLNQAARVRHRLELRQQCKGVRY